MGKLKKLLGMEGNRVFGIKDKTIVGRILKRIVAGGVEVGVGTDHPRVHVKVNGQDLRPPVPPTATPAPTRRACATAPDRNKAVIALPDARPTEPNDTTSNVRPPGQSQAAWEHLSRRGAAKMGRVNQQHLAAYAQAATMEELQADMKYYNRRRCLDLLAEGVSSAAKCEMADHSEQFVNWDYLCGQLGDIVQAREMRRSKL